MGSQFGLSHEQRNWMLAFVLPIQIVTTVLCWIRLSARFQRNGGQFGLDDVFIAIAWVLGTGVSAAVLLSTYRYGVNRHVWDVPPRLYPGTALLGFVVEVLFFFSTCLTKISVLMFYRRLVSGTYSQTFKWAIWAAIAFVIIYTIIFFCLLITTCTPVEAIWQQFSFEWVEKHKFKCASDAKIVAASKAAGGLSVVTDFYSVMLPALLLMRIRISQRQRYGLMFIFGIGYLVVAAGIARTVYLGRVQGSQPDKTWFAFDVFAASVAECNIAIICACAPSLKFLFSKYSTVLTTKMSSSRGSSLSSTQGGRFRARSRASKLRLDRFHIVRNGGSGKGFDSNGTARTGRRPSTTMGLSKMSPPVKNGGSFIHTHELGVETFGRVSEAYEEPPSSRKGSRASVHIVLDPESNMKGPNLVLPPSPSTPAYPGRLSIIRAAKSPGSEDIEMNAASPERSNFSFSAFKPGGSSSDEEDETHLMGPISPHEPISTPVSPREQYGASDYSAITHPQSLRPGAQLPPFFPPMGSVRSPSIVAPWDEPSKAQIETMGPKRKPIEDVRPNPHRKLSKDKWDKPKGERTTHPAMY